MKIWNFAISIPLIALGLNSWRHAEWFGTEEGYDVVRDGTCAGLYGLIFYLIAIGLFGLAIGALTLRWGGRRRHTP